MMTNASDCSARQMGRKLRSAPSIITRELARYVA